MSDSANPKLTIADKVALFAYKVVRKERLANDIDGFVCERDGVRSVIIKVSQAGTTNYLQWSCADANRIASFLFDVTEQ